MKVSVVIPAYNEVQTIAEVLRRICSAQRDVEIVIVDDGSTDGTREVLRSRPDVTVVFHEQNAGKGAAIRTGLAYVSGDVVIVQDADLEYSPDDYPVLLAPILTGDADVVYGSRFLGGPHRVLFFWHSVANGLLTLLSNMLSDLNLTDMETCYKMVRAPVMKSLVFTTDRFGFEPEITARLAQAKARIWEVSITYSGRTYAEGKKIRWKDGVAALFHIVRFNLFPPAGSRR